MSDDVTKFHVNLPHDGLRTVFRTFAKEHGFNCVRESSGAYSSIFIVDLKNKTIKTPLSRAEIPSAQYYVEVAMAKITARCEAERQTGRTTGLMLQAVGEAILKPGEFIIFKDHDRSTYSQCEHYAAALRDLIACLKLECINIMVSHGCSLEPKIYIKSTFGIK